MKTSASLKTVTGLSLVLAVAAVGVCMYLLTGRAQLELRLAKLEERTAAQRPPKLAEVAEAVSLQIEEDVVASLERRQVEREAGRVAEEDAAVRKSLASELAEVEQLAMRLDVLEGTVRETREDAQMFEQALVDGRLPTGESVDDLIDRRISERGLSGGGDRKPSFSELAATLELDEVQKVDVARAIDLGKDRAFEIFDTPRADGGNFMDDFVHAIRNATEGDGEQAAMMVFMNALGVPYPGTNETYGAKLFGTAAETSMQIRELLTAEQQASYDQLEIDLLEVKTGHDPFEERLMERLTQPVEGADR